MSDVCVVCDVRDCRDSRDDLDCADRTRDIIGCLDDNAVVVVGSGGVLDSLRLDQREESVERTRLTCSSMASRVCCEMAEIPSSNVSVRGMCNSLDDKGAILTSLRGGDETGNGWVVFAAPVTAAGDADVVAGGARATADSRKDETACAARC